jgi:hypothetical protein
MPARRQRAKTSVRSTKAAPSKLVSLCLDMEEVLNDARDAARVINLIGHGLHDFVDEKDARAITAAAWNACQKIEALRRVWGDLFKAAGRVAAR